MAVVRLLQAEFSPSAPPASWGLSKSLYDTSVVDISNLETGPEPDAVALVQTEVPLLGADGRITGVLCPPPADGFRRAPLRGPDDDSTKIYVHDIANLLSVIDGGLRLLDVKTGAEDRAAILDRLHRAIDRGAALSRQLLDLSRPEAGRRSPANHERVVVDLSDMLDRALRADIAVEIYVDPRLREFTVDPEQLHLSLLNLCKNASDAMLDGGTICISARNMDELPDNPRVEIAVADSGTGMSSEVLARIFEPYFTTKEPGKGTGLGLDQVRRFVEQSRGSISVESVPAEGTTARMIFPCA